MALALVVEDGTGVAGAQSYLTVAELRAFAAQRALTVPESDDSIIPLLVKASDFLALKTYIGTRAINGQGLDWPRFAIGYFSVSDGVYTYTIPQNLKTAQAILALEAQNGELSWAVRPGKYRKTKLSSLYTEFATDVDRAADLRISSIDYLLKDLVSPSSFRPMTVLRA